MYKDVAKNIDIFEIKNPVTVVPTPTDEDYNLGFIRRYFIQKANDEYSFIFEVSESVYTEHIKNPFWKGTTIKWRIRGPIDPVYSNNGDIDDRGIKYSNKAAIGLASQTIKNVGLYLPNILQFYK